MGYSRIKYRKIIIKVLRFVSHFLYIFSGETLLQFILLMAVLVSSANKKYYLIFCVANLRSKQKMRHHTSRVENNIVLFLFLKCILITRGIPAAMHTDIDISKYTSNIHS